MFSNDGAGGSSRLPPPPSAAEWFGTGDLPMGEGGILVSREGGGSQATAQRLTAQHAELAAHTSDAEAQLAQAVEQCTAFAAAAAQAEAQRQRLEGGQAAWAAAVQAEPRPGGWLPAVTCPPVWGAAPLEGGIPPDSLRRIEICHFEQGSPYDWYLIFWVNGRWSKNARIVSPLQS